MAILKSQLEEPVLTRSERALLQTLQHAACLADGIKVLESLKGLAQDNHTVDSGGTVELPVSEMEQAEQYLKAQIASLIKGYKLPRVASDSKSET